MGHEDRFDDLIASLGGFHRSWLIYLGIELGLFARIRESGAGGITPENAAEATAAVGPFGIDVCTGVRTDGVLDDAKLAGLFAALGA